MLISVKAHFHARFISCTNNMKQTINSPT